MMDEAMKDKSFEEKKALLEKWGEEANSALENLVNREMDAAHERISVDDLLVHKTEEAQQQALDERAAEISKAIERSGVKMTEELSGKVDHVMGHSSAMIKAILQDDSLSDEEKKRRIAEIDAMTKEKIARLSSTQVAAEHELESFEESESGFDEDAAAQMAALEEILRQAQMGYTRHMVSERALLQDTSNQVVGLLNNLMNLMEQEGMAAGGELSHEQQQQKIELEKLMLSVKATGQEMSSYAQEALQLS